MAERRVFGDKPARKSGRPHKRYAKTEAELADWGLKYLKRFDTTVFKLRRYLLSKIDKSEGALVRPEHIERLLERYQSSGLISDQRFAARSVERLRERGTSARAVRFKLAAHGIDATLADSALQSAGKSESDELKAAEAYARRRRLGPFRQAAEQKAHYQKDLAKLVRAGFEFEIARKIMGRSYADDLF